jgi:uncharacterized membrane protein YqjE
MRGQHDRSLPEVLQAIIGNLQEILHAEFQLAKTEIKEEAAEARTSAVTLGVGLVLATYALGLLLLALVYALATHMAVWSAALIVGGGVAVLAALLIHGGREGLKRVNAKSETLIASLKENVQWAKRQIE